MKQDLKWPAVVVILGLMVVLGWLADRGKDATFVLAGITLLLSALGYGVLQTKQSEIATSTAKIEEQTNGRIGQLAEMIHHQQADLARVNDDHHRALTSMADQNRRDMRDMADMLARMSPPPIPTSGVPAPEDDHSSNL